MSGRIQEFTEEMLAVARKNEGAISDVDKKAQSAQGAASQAQ